MTDSGTRQKLRTYVFLRGCTGTVTALPFSFVLDSFSFESVLSSEETEVEKCLDDEMRERWGCGGVLCCSVDFAGFEFARNLDWEWLEK